LTKDGWAKGSVGNRHSGLELKECVTPVGKIVHTTGHFRAEKKKTRRVVRYGGEVEAKGHRTRFAGRRVPLRNRAESTRANEGTGFTGGAQRSLHQREQEKSSAHGKYLRRRGRAPLYVKRKFNLVVKRRTQVETQKKKKRGKEKLAIGDRRKAVCSGQVLKKMKTASFS